MFGQRRLLPGRRQLHPLQHPNRGGSLLARLPRFASVLTSAALLVLALPGGAQSYPVDEGSYDSFYEDYDGWVDLGYTVEQEDGVYGAQPQPMCAIDPDTNQCITDPCRTAIVRNWAKRRIDGGLIYRIVNYVAFCYNGTSITYIDRRHYIDYCCGYLWHFRDWENLYNVGGVGSSQAETYVQAKLEACEAWCFKEVHPWSDIVVNANGSWTWSRGGS